MMSRSLLSFWFAFAADALSTGAHLRSDYAMTAPDRTRESPNPFGQSSELTLFFNRGDSGSADHDNAIESE
jgi:hypothetical protein